MKVRNEVQLIICYGNKYLVVKKDSNWRLVKGGVKELETEEKAIERELWEELGKKPKAVKVGRKFHQYVFEKDNIKHFVSTYFVTFRDKKIKLGKELSDYKLLNKEEVNKLLKVENERIAFEKFFSRSKSN